MRNYINRIWGDLNGNVKPPTPAKDKWIVSGLDDTPKLEQASYGAATKQEAIDKAIRNNQAAIRECASLINREMDEIARCNTLKAKLASLLANTS